MTDFIMLKSDAPEEDVSNLLMEISYDMGMIQAAKDQAAKLKARIDAATKRINERRAVIEKWMLANEYKTKRLPEATLSMASTRSKVIITDEDALPLHCFTEKVVRSVNEDLVKAMLLAKVDVGGATLSNAAPQLKIKF